MIVSLASISNGWFVLGKKYYGWSVTRWLEGDPTQPAPPANRWQTRDRPLEPIACSRCDLDARLPGNIPDFCQWDLMFHAVALCDC
jgi:hypothetical protein